MQGAGGGKKSAVRICKAIKKDYLCTPKTGNGRFPGFWRRRWRVVNQRGLGSNTTSADYSR
jgi:hypothetical protein